MIGINHAIYNNVWQSPAHANAVFGARTKKGISDGQWTILDLKVYNYPGHARTAVYCVENRKINPYFNPTAPTA